PVVLLEWEPVADEWSELERPGSEEPHDPAPGGPRGAEDALEPELLEGDVVGDQARLSNAGDPLQHDRAPAAGERQGRGGPAGTGGRFEDQVEPVSKVLREVSGADVGDVGRPQAPAQGEA